MKRLCCLFLCGVLFLCACNSVPTEAPSELKIETEAPTEQNDETENNDPNSKGSADFWAGCDEGEDGTLYVYIKEGGEEFEEELTKIGYDYNKVDVSYVKYSQVDILTQYGHLKERIQNAGEEIYGIVKAYGTGFQGITVSVNENNEEKMAKIRALADDPEVVTVQYVEGEPVNH